MSTVSKRNFAKSKYAFDNIVKDLQDVNTYAPLRSQNFNRETVRKSTLFVEMEQHFLEKPIYVRM